jgi:hypothetical protein
MTGRHGRDVDPRIVELDAAAIDPAGTASPADGRFVAHRRMARHDRRPEVLAVVAALLAAVVIVKPWSEPAAAIAPPARTVIAVADRPDPTPEPDGLAGLRHDCADPLGWRVYSHEIWTDERVRAWHRLDPVAAASGPLDRDIPVVQIGSGTTALGYCSPWTGSERPPADASVAAWRIVDGAATGDRSGSDDRRATPLALRSIAPAVPTVLGALYGLIPSHADASETNDTRGWEPGEVVFAVRGANWQRWWAVNLPVPRTAATTQNPPATP